MNNTILRQSAPCIFLHPHDDAWETPGNTSIVLWGHTVSLRLKVPPQDLLSTLAYKLGICLGLASAPYQLALLEEWMGLVSALAAHALPAYPDLGEAEEHLPGRKTLSELNQCIRNMLHSPSPKRDALCESFESLLTRTETALRDIPGPLLRDDTAFYAEMGLCRAWLFDAWKRNAGENETGGDIRRRAESAITILDRHLNRIETASAHMRGYSRRPTPRETRTVLRDEAVLDDEEASLRRRLASCGHLLRRRFIAGEIRLAYLDAGLDILISRLEMPDTVPPGVYPEPVRRLVQKAEQALGDLESQGFPSLAGRPASRYCGLSRAGRVRKRGMPSTSVYPVSLDITFLSNDEPPHMRLTLADTDGTLAAQSRLQAVLRNGDLITFDVAPPSSGETGSSGRSSPLPRE